MNATNVFTKKITIDNTDYYVPIKWIITDKIAYKITNDYSHKIILRKIEINGIEYHVPYSIFIPLHKTN